MGVQSLWSNFHQLRVAALAELMLLAKSRLFKRGSRNRVLVTGIIQLLWLPFVCVALKKKILFSGVSFCCDFGIATPATTVSGVQDLAVLMTTVVGELIFVVVMVARRDSLCNGSRFNSHIEILVVMLFSSLTATSYLLVFSLCYKNVILPYLLFVILFHLCTWHQLLL